MTARHCDKSLPDFMLVAVYRIAAAVMKLSKSLVRKQSARCGQIAESVCLVPLQSRFLSQCRPRPGDWLLNGFPALSLLRILEFEIKFVRSFRTALGRRCQTAADEDRENWFPNCGTSLSGFYSYEYGQRGKVRTGQTKNQEKKLSGK